LEANGKQMSQEQARDKTRNKPEKSLKIKPKLTVLFSIIN